MRHQGISAQKPKQVTHNIKLNDLMDIRPLILVFQFSNKFQQFPLYLKSSVVANFVFEHFEKCLESKLKPYVILDMSSAIQKIEANFLMEMNIYFNYIAISMGTQFFINKWIANQLSQSKKLFSTKVRENIHARRSAEMAKNVHHFLKRNHVHWNKSNSWTVIYGVLSKLF